MSEHRSLGYSSLGNYFPISIVSQSIIVKKEIKATVIKSIEIKGVVRTYDK